MRVIAGEARGTTLRGPTTDGTRPMADRVKGALFSSMASMGIEPDRVLDLYAGTGSIGIEALSRGATWAEFVDRHAPAAAVIRENLRRTHNAARAEVHTESVEAFVRRRGRGRTTPYDLIVLDPPYADDDIVERVAEVATAGVLAAGGVIVVGHAARVTLPDQIGPLERFRHRCHGDSCFSLYDRPDDGTEGAPGLPEALGLERAAGGSDAPGDAGEGTRAADAGADAGADAAAASRPGPARMGKDTGSA